MIDDTVLNFSLKIFVALLLFGLFFIVARVITGTVNKLTLRHPQYEQPAILFSQSIKILMLALGLLAALGSLGVNVSAVIAGIGLTGAAIGLAFKDTVANALAGVMLLIHRPFKLQDRIRVQTFEGQVISIDLHYTTIRSEEGQVLLPNYILVTTPIVVRG